MSYSEIFGGALLFPSQLSYLSISTAVDVTLQWPTEQQIAGVDVVADFLDIDATVGSLNIDMPSATNTSTGNKTTINNIGSNSFDVRDSTGGAIQTVAPGEQWVIVLRDNTTAAGLWRTFQLGASVSVASASALAGAGIKAISTTLNQKIDSDVEAATPFTAVDGDRAKCLVYTAGAGTCNLTAAGTVGDDWFFMLHNAGSGTLNVLPPSGTIDGSASINLQVNESTFIFTDGTDYFTIGLSSGSTLAFDYVSIAVPGSGDFVLSGANLDRISYNFTGALTGNRRIVVPNTTQQYWVDNQTSGAFTLEIDTAAGAGQIIPQGESVIVYCDGTDVINATSSTSVAFPITIGQGGTGATTASGALTNLGGVSTARLINTAALSGLAGGGDLSADRSLVVDVSNLTLGAAFDGTVDMLAFYDDDGVVTLKTTLNDLGLPVPDPTALTFGTIMHADGAGGWQTVNNPGLSIALNGQTSWNGSGWDITTGADSMSVFISGSPVTLSMLAGGSMTVLNLNFPEVLIANSMYITERAARQSGNAGEGQLWVESNSPNNLMFSDDTSQDFNISPLEGNFTPGWGGFSVNPAATIRYKIIGNMVFVDINPTLATGTSNATSFTITGVPAAIQPARSTIVSLHDAVSGGVAIDGMSIDIQQALGTWVCGAGHGNPGGGGWLNDSNSKGFATGDSWVFSYQLT